LPVLFFFASSLTLTGDRDLKNLAGKFFSPAHDALKYTFAGIPKAPPHPPPTANPKGPPRPKITALTVNSGHKSIVLPKDPSFGPKMNLNNEIQKHSKAKEPTFP
jgi:hypothetical protein